MKIMIGSRIGLPAQKKLEERKFKQITFTIKKGVPFTHFIIQIKETHYVVSFFLNKKMEVETQATDIRQLLAEIYKRTGIAA